MVLLLHTDGSGILSKVTAEVHHKSWMLRDRNTTYHIAYMRALHERWFKSDSDSESDGDDTKYMSNNELLVYFDNTTWMINHEGLIYSDKLWIKELHEFMLRVGFSDEHVKLVRYSEQGMQGPNYVSLDAPYDIVHEWKRIVGIVNRPLRIRNVYS